MNKFAGVIEGFASAYRPRGLPKANSDLSPSSNFPNGSMRVFHGAGTTDEENNAGRWTNTPDATLRAAFWAVQVLWRIGGHVNGPYHSENPPSKRRRVSVPSTLLLGAGRSA
tara:strand:+ start:50 stop:385 length:336 start_codon:yes stop_codon:yes gene_type:complete